jgi:two-component system, response regulator
MNNKFIFLVEDNPDEVTLTLRTFKKNRILNDVVVAHDGSEALEYLFGTGAYAERDTGIQPAFVMLDLNLPKVSGLEVLKAIRGDERTRLLPVVVLTSSDEERDFIQSYRLGANSYVRKPVDFNRFSEVMRQLALYWLVLNQVPPRPRRQP